MTDYMRTRVKICGLRTVEHIQLVADCGADAIGLVFHESSPRHVDLKTAQMLRQSVPAFMTVAALFLDAEDALIEQVIDQVNPDCLQFHGSETPDYCEQWQRPYIKGIPMGSVDDANAYADAYNGAQGFLLDSHAAGRQGGSGDTFDWSKIPSDFHYPLILAGGLTPLNVASAVAQVRPWAVDVSSGVESAKGIKDDSLIRQFCNEVKRVDCQS